jgi:hypothetical protein
VLFRDDNGGNPCKDGIKEMKGDLRDWDLEKLNKKRFGNSEFRGFKVWGNFVSQPYSPLSSQILY